MSDEIRMKVGEVNLDVLPALTLGMTVAFPRPLKPYQRALMDTLGVNVEYRPTPVATSHTVEAAAALHQLDQGESVAVCSTCVDAGREQPNEAAWTRGKFAYKCVEHARQLGWRGTTTPNATRAPQHARATSLALAVDDPLRRAEAKVDEARKKYHDAEKHLEREKKRAAKYVGAVKSASDSLEGHRRNLAEALHELANEVSLLEPVRRD